MDAAIDYLDAQPEDAFGPSAAPSPTARAHFERLMASRPAFSERGSEAMRALFAD